METLVAWYQNGGPVMIALLILSGAGVVALAERFVQIVLRAKTNARPFIEQVIALVRADKVEEALKLCAVHESALPDLGIIILRSRVDDEHGLKNVAAAATLTVVPQLTRRLNWLPVLAKLSILVGLFGGVVNLQQSLAQPIPGASDPWMGAVVFALHPVAAGLFTAIPLFAGHAALDHEARKMIGQLEEFSARLVNALVDRPDVRLGHR